MILFLAGMACGCLLTIAVDVWLRPRAGRRMPCETGHHTWLPPEMLVCRFCGCQHEQETK